MYIIAIDVGIKNLAFIVYEIKTKKVVCWERVAVAGDDQYMPQNNVDYMYELVAKYQRYFDMAMKVIIEKQMRANMRIIEAILHTMFFPICDVISAKHVKLHFDLSTKNYRLNKKVAVEFIQNYLEDPDLVSNKEECQLQFAESTKKDDLADAMLLLLYYLKTFTQEFPEGEHGTQG